MSHQTKAYSRDMCYLIGNMPAIDLLKLHDNEGHGYSEDLKICFAGESQISAL